MKESKEFAPTTIRHKCSILKKMTVAQREPQPDVLWKQLKGWIDNLERDYKQQNAMAFDGEELQHWIATSDHSFPPKLQKNLIAIVAYTGGLRVHEDYMLTFEDFTYSNQKHEFVVKVPKIKGNVEGKTFIVQQ